MTIPHTLDHIAQQLHVAPGLIQAGAAAFGVAVIGCTIAAFRLGRRRIRAVTKDRAKVITALTNLAALVATGVQASGMWKFFGSTMGLPIGFRVFMFSFMEIALLACGLRARANVEEGGDAGVDGALVWALALASGLMSSTEANSPQEAVMRVVTSTFVALLWTRDLMAAKKAARAANGDKKRSGPVRWRITKERVAVWLHLADAIDTDVVTVESARQVAKYLRSKDRERNGRALPFTAKGRARRGEMRLVDVALRHGDPTEVLQRLSEAKFGEAMENLGIANANGNAKPATPTASPRVAPALPPAANRPAAAPTLATTDNRSLATTPTANRVETPTANGVANANANTGDSTSANDSANDNPGGNLATDANRQPAIPAVAKTRANTGDNTSGATEALVVAMRPAYAELLRRNGGKRPTAPELVAAVDGVNTHSRAKQIRDIVEDRWFPEMKPRFHLVNGTEALAQAS